jgi:hypothetical protein
MNFVDATLVRLADPATRAGAVDQTALSQLVATAYETQGATVEGPYQALFDEFRLGFSAPPISQLEGSWTPVGGAKVEAQFRMSGIGSTPPIRVDAFWRGGIVARTVRPSGQVTEVEVSAWPDLASIDADIVSDLGALPSDSAGLEQERRARLLTRVRSVLDQPDALTPQRLNEWLGRLEARSVSELLTRPSATAGASAVQVTYSAPQAVTPSPMLLPLAAGLLIRDQGLSVAELLMESKLVRQQLDPLGLERPRDAPLKRRRALRVGWVIPESVFDDPDWPGGDDTMTEAQRRGARRSAAGQWLAQEGIGLVTIGSAP